MRLWDTLKFLVTGRATVIDPWIGYMHVIIPWGARWRLVRENAPRPLRPRQKDIQMPPYEGADDTEGWEIPEEWFNDPSLRWSDEEEDEDGRSAS